MKPAINHLLAQGLVIGIIVWVRFGAAKAPEAWQNPNIGFTVDAIADANDVSGVWKSSGLVIRAAELIIGANIDPYASLMVNVLISQQGVELHEAFSEFPSLPLNLKLKGGLMLANFGRWNRFHTHAMPFTSEPRLYHEYAGGMMVLRGIELSWLVPIAHYIEITASAYDLLSGHSHDVDPPDNSPDLTADKVANMIGAIPHGDHYDYKGRHIYDVNDLYAIAGLPSPNDPEIFRWLRRPQDFAYGCRVASSFDFGYSVSADVGGSFLYQGLWKRSKRSRNGFPEFYDKFLWGADIVFFWHPPSANKYRNLQTGIEVVGTMESYEKLTPVSQVITGWRTGGIAHFDYQHTQQWHVGAFGSLFQSNDLNKNLRLHAGGYVTFTITHYQYLRLEYSRFDYPGFFDRVNRIMLQYNATIGYHTHGRQR